MAAKKNDAYRAYRADVTGERLIPAVRAGILVIVGITATFPILDWIAFPDRFWALTAVRLALGISFLPLWIWTPRAPERAMLAAVFIEGVHLVAVIGIAGGITSPYYPGIMLLFLGLPAVAPVTARQVAGMLSPLLILFGTLPLLGAGDVELRDYMMSMFFAGGSLVVSVISSWLLDNLRFQDHQRREEITSARDKLAKLDDAKTRFTANVHHELRTPLTLMLAPLEGIRSGDYGFVSEDLVHPLRTVHTNGKRLLKLINNLLDLTKLESQQFEIRRRPLNIRESLLSIVDRAGPMAKRKGIDLIVNAGHVRTIYADGDALEQVLVNLVGNALKFTETGGCIEVGAKTNSDGVEVWIRDTGIGLATDQLDRVFDRFAQVDGSVTRKHEGTGIGLSIAHELIDRHGGRIWAESDGLGQGTTMRFALPLGESDDQVDEPAVTTAASDDKSSRRATSVENGFDAIRRDTRYTEFDHSVERWEQRRARTYRSPSTRPDTDTNSRPVLVVDDNTEMRDLIGFILGRDFVVYSARDGREALDVVEREELDLVVSDIMMPEMSGTELCASIKKNPEFREIPVMLVSSKAESEMKIEGLEMGADDYVTKPFHPRELLARAHTLVGLRRAQRELAKQNIELEDALQTLQQAQAQLVQSERLAAVGELAAGIAHEVNNPINYALNAARVISTPLGEIGRAVDRVASLEWSDLSRTVAKGADIRDDLQRIDISELADEVINLGQIMADGLERTRVLVDNLRDFAAPGNQGVQKPVDVRNGIQSTVQLLGHALDNLGTSVELTLPDNLSFAEGDPGALNQIFLNLIKNAAEAMEPTGGVIAIEIFEEYEEIHVRIRDQGPGVDIEAQNRIFEPFFTTKDPGQGTGLGLSICRQIVAAHGGRLELESTTGQGACFVLSIPVHQGAA